MTPLQFIPKWNFRIDSVRPCHCQSLQGKISEMEGMDFLILGMTVDLYAPSTPIILFSIIQAKLCQVLCQIGRFYLNIALFVAVRVRRFFPRRFFRGFFRFLPVKDMRFSSFFRPKLERTPFLKFCPDKTGKNLSSSIYAWTKLEETSIASQSPI